MNTKTDRRSSLPRLERYEVLSLLGVGGMGEVYRARDTRLARDVALKLLPAELSSDRARLRRFEQEARAASSLNHPNIVTVYEIDSEGSVPYIAMELIDGQTLRQLLRRGPLPLRKLLDVAVSIGDGLARAHESGIVHRDLKPENVMVSTDGLVKILDFGLAKFRRSPVEGGVSEEAGTVTVETSPGVLLGTLRYMSPEQAGGGTVDYRSDQFSFGSMLYEMASGTAAFDKGGAVDTLSAILHAEPEPLEQASPGLPTSVRWIIERSLAKDPRDRYESTRDLARDLANLRSHLSEAVISEKGSRLFRGRRKIWPWLVGISGCLTLLAIGVLTGRSIGNPVAPRFQQITFRHEGVTAARFAPDGDTIVYGAALEGTPVGLLSARPESPEVRPLGFERAQVLSISPSAEMAVLLGPSFGRSLGPPHGFIGPERDQRLLYGTLARVPLAGGVPREILEEVREADWGPEGRDLAVIHYLEGSDRLEYPIGRTLYQDGDWLNHPRVSPDGKFVAFARRSLLTVVDLAGKIQALGEEGVSELAWSRSREEIWFSKLRTPGFLGGTVAGTTEIHAVGLGGKNRLVASLPGDFVFLDLSRAGRALLGQVFESAEIFGSFPEEQRERNLSWLDQSTAVSVSADGQMLLFNERGRAIYVRKTDGSPAKRLGDGWAWALSPDGQFVLALAPSLALLPTGAGETKLLDTGKVSGIGRSGFFPDGKRVFFMGREKGRGQRAWVMSLSGGVPRPVSPEGTRRGVIAGDGRFVAARAATGQWFLYPTEGGEPSLVSGLLAGEEPMQFSTDGKFLYVRGSDQLLPGEKMLMVRIYRVDPWTGKRQLWKEIPPVAPATGGEVGSVFFAADGRICIYNHHRYAVDLYVVDGWK